MKQQALENKQKAEEARRQEILKAQEAKEKH